MKKNFYYFAFLLFVLILFFNLSCKKASEPEDNTPKTQEYCITLVDTFTGNPLSDFRVAMVRNDTELSNGKTDSSGKVCFVVDTGVYDIYSNIDISKNVLDKEYFGSIMKLDLYNTSHIDVKIDIPKKDDIFDPKFPVHGGLVAYFHPDDHWYISGIRKRLKPKVYPDKEVFNYPNIKQVLTVDLKRLTQGKLDYTIDEFEVASDTQAENDVFKFVLSDYGSAISKMNNFEIIAAQARAPLGLINKIRREVFKSIVGGDDTDVPYAYDSIMGHIDGFTQRDIRVLHYKMDKRNPDDYIVENNEHPYEVRTIPENTYSEEETGVVLYGGWAEVVEPDGFYMRKRYIMIPPPSAGAIIGTNSGVYINGENCRDGACTVSTGNSPYPPSPFKTPEHLMPEYREHKR